MTKKQLQVEIDRLKAENQRLRESVRDTARCGLHFSDLYYSTPQGARDRKSSLLNGTWHE